MHALLHSVPPTLQQATADLHLHRRLLDTHGQVWVSHLWGHCSFLLGPGVHKVLLIPSKSLFPQSYVSSGSSMVEFNGNLNLEGLCHTQVCCPQSPCPCDSPRLACTSTGDTQTQFCLSLCGVSGSWWAQGLLELSEHLWQVWGLILNAILPLLPYCRGFSALGHGVFPHSRSSALQPPLQHCAATASVTLCRRQGSRQSPRQISAQRQNGCLKRPYR